MKSLKEIWNDLNAQGLGSDKGSDHSYIDYYETLLAPYRNTAANILEIGIFKGHSLLLWENYFSGRVYGIDCDEQPHGGMADLRPMIASGEHNITIMDACSYTEAEKHFGDLKFDVICDDAAHSIEQEVELFNLWKNYMNEGGLYAVEDVQNIDESRPIFEALAPGKRVEIIDLRHVKNRYDDVIVLIHF